eukprot:COSAG05_NODE_5215_length_1234_cov_1.577093_3_plen_61_part_01
MGTCRYLQTSPIGADRKALHLREEPYLHALLLSQADQLRGNDSGGATEKLARARSLSLAHT